jgi:hypothetical protein
MGRAADSSATTGLLLAVLLAAAAAGAGEQPPQAEAELPGNRLVSTVPVTSAEEAAVANQLVQAVAMASRELVTGEVDDHRVLAYSQPEGAEHVDVEALATKVLATALVSCLSQPSVHKQVARQLWAVLHAGHVAWILPTSTLLFDSPTSQHAPVVASPSPKLTMRAIPLSTARRPAGRWAS